MPDELAFNKAVEGAIDVLREDIYNISEFLDSDDYREIQLPANQEKQLLELLDKHEFKGSLKAMLLYYCSKLIPLFVKDCQELKEVSMDDLNTQRKDWDNMIENLQVRMNNVSSNAKERLSSMIQGATLQRENLKVIKGTKQKPINTHMKPIALHLHCLAYYERTKIVEFIYDLYCTFNYENYGKRHKEDSIYNELSAMEKKKQKNAVKREDKKLIDDWYRSTFDALEIP